MLTGLNMYKSGSFFVKESLLVLSIWALTNVLSSEIRRLWNYFFAGFYGTRPTYIDSGLHFNIFIAVKTSCSYLWKMMQGFSKIIRSNLEKRDTTGEIFQPSTGHLSFKRNFHLFSSG